MRHSRIKISPTESAAAQTTNPLGRKIWGRKILAAGVENFPAPNIPAKLCLGFDPLSDRRSTDTISTTTKRRPPRRNLCCGGLRFVAADSPDPGRLLTRSAKSGEVAAVWFVFAASRLCVNHGLDGSQRVTSSDRPPWLGCGSFACLHSPAPSPHFSHSDWSSRLPDARCIGVFAPDLSSCGLKQHHLAVLT